MDSGGEAEGGLALVESLEQAIEFAAGECPLEGLGDLLVVALEGEQALLDCGEVVEVVRGEYFAPTTSTVTYQSPDRSGLIDLTGRVVAPGRTGSGGRKPNAADEGRR